MKKITSLCLIISVMFISILVSGFTFFKKTNPDTQNTKPVIEQGETINNILWCITLQLVWNDFTDKITGGKPVMLQGGNPPIVDELNKRLYSKDDISDDSYYQVYGEISKKLKKQIEKNIYKKFKEKSDILDMINWNASNSYLFYVMLKKNFTFIKEFENLPDASFGVSDEKYKFFGAGKNSSDDIKNNINIIFYNSHNEYAVKLLTKENEEVILFRTDKDDSFENLYKYIIDNKKSDSFTDDDKLKVPYLDVNKVISYDEICGKRINDTNYVITQVLQTIKFKMDNKGGSLKSEAAIGLMRASLPAENMTRLFYFDKPFVLFLKEAEKDKPYYAMRVDDTSFLVRK